MKLRLCACAALLVLAPGLGTLPAQTAPESYGVYTEHPRLFLRPQRLKLLRREKERNSLRWDQFRTLVAGGAPMPEPGFAHGLYYRVTDDEAAARRAIEAALNPKTSIRQVALVYDWCQPVLTPPQKERLKTRLHAALQAKRDTSMDSMRDRVLAAVALGEDDKAASDSAVRDIITNDWNGRIIGALKSGRSVIHGSDTYALLELLHAIRDNLGMDLRQEYPAYFRQLPLFDLLSYYPPPYPAAENEFRIPFSPEPGEPDLRVAALSRAGELAMVAFDTNAPETQVLQGWLLNDNFLMRGTFGITYEFLWANPYQPGLSYYHVPLVLHDELFGRLLVRSSWEDDATWAGYIDGKLQIFRDGRVIPLDAAAGREPLDLEEAKIFFASEAVKAGKGSFTSGEKDANDVFVVGLPPRFPFHVEAQDEEMRELSSDPGGVLYLKGLRRQINVRFTARTTSHGLAPKTNP
jgi:hypothetical protein